ncbi:hypothetical protein BDQ12DRAFT_691389 [Crucibulum laeve]|uniref:Uncharacterized protein n=1 Tax=Crucibulum laeve TaxID=68775 RepID=A0A5C3LMV7_9AGAR|nr:hypothetical protein BDQ12DRAFT_691389 [Crucibulum laeve]
MLSTEKKRKNVVEEGGSSGATGASSKKTKHDADHNQFASAVIITIKDDNKAKSLPQAPESPLLRLLDFPTFDNQDDISHRFDEIANSLLHSYHLVVNCGDAETKFEILELEFYLHMAGCHEDPFTHGSEEQKICGRWYFHRAPRRSEDSLRSATSLTGYRGGSRKGLDLTIGRRAPLATTTSQYFPSQSSSSQTSEEKPSIFRGGILLRSIRRLGPDPKVISGPSLLVDQVLLLCKAASILELVEDTWSGDTTAFHSTNGEDAPSAALTLQPRPATTAVPPTIYTSPRIGLDLSHPGTTPPPEHTADTTPLHPRIVFLPKLYRYFVHPKELTTKGRPQTFLAMLHSRLSSCPDIDRKLKSGGLSNNIARMMGLKESTASKYLADYVAGREAGRSALKAFVGVKDSSSSPAAYLKMMGALERVCEVERVEGSGGFNASTES